MIVLPNQVYAEPGGIPLTFDFFRPDNGVPPLLVFLHGGGWISGDKSMYREEAAWFAERGFACACISYRLAPLHPYPSAVEDALAFVRYARAEAEELQIDANRIGAMGNSAGAHLAAMLGVLPDRVQAVVDVCGITDLTNPRDVHLPIAMAFLEQFMGCSHDGNEAKWAEASPITHVNPASAPFLIIHGDMDDVVPLEQSRSFHSRLGQAGVSSELKIMPGEGHSFSWEAWVAIRELSLKFFERELV
ncbi:MAG: alpha/beta hydrolase [Fimbriimonadaceae bacterium]|nr:alpha/beta hydrolase [Fimbriimonadaceae bacterium]